MKSKQSILYAAIGVILVVLVIAGGFSVLNRVTSEPSVVLTSNCEPPCWNGIRTGETTRWEAEAILEKDGKVSRIDYEMSKRDTSQIAKIVWYFKRPARDSLGSIDLEGDRARAINIYTIGSLTISDAFQKLGQPGQMWTHLGKGENREFLEVTLLYPENGYVIEVNMDLEGKSDFVEIRDNTPVFRVTYFDPGQFQELLETQILIKEPVSVRKGSLQPWPGLGKIPFERK